MALLDTWLRKTFGRGTTGGRALSTLTTGRDPRASDLATTALATMRAAGAGATDAPPATPDLTDEVLRQVRLAEMKRQQIGTTRQSTFVTANRSLLGGLS